MSWPSAGVQWCTVKRLSVLKSSLKWWEAISTCQKNQIINNWCESSCPFNEMRAASFDFQCLVWVRWKSALMSVKLSHHCESTQKCNWIKYFRSKIGQTENSNLMHLYINLRSVLILINEYELNYRSIKALSLKYSDKGHQLWAFTSHSDKQIVSRKVYYSSQHNFLMPLIINAYRQMFMLTEKKFKRCASELNCW